MTADTLKDVPEFSERSYEDLRVGDRFGPFDEPLTAPAADALRGPVGEPRSGDQAPLGALPMLTLRALRRALDGIIAGGVLMGQRFVVHTQLPAEATLQIDVAVTAQQRRRGRLETTFTFACSHDGLLAATVDWRIMAPPR